MTFTCLNDRYPCAMKTSQQPSPSIKGRRSISKAPRFNINTWIILDINWHLISNQTHPWPLYFLPQIVVETLSWSHISPYTNLTKAPYALRSLSHKTLNIMTLVLWSPSLWSRGTPCCHSNSHLVLITNTRGTSIRNLNLKKTKEQGVVKELEQIWF